jgi:hypothetical protein
MTDEEKRPDPSSGPWDMVRTGFERLGETLDATAKTARLSLDIGALNARGNGLFQEMGRKVYELYGKGLVKNASLLAFCADAAEIEAQIAQKRAQIAELRGQRGEGGAVEEPEEMGIEEDPGETPPTSSTDLNPEEEQTIRPPSDRRL